jgi:hypothetical protein
MRAVTIHDMRPLGRGQVLAVDLIDILRLCEADVTTSSWKCSYVECLGDLACEFMSVGDAQGIISGEELLRLASGVYQVIWGDFEAYRTGESRPWLVVRAVDSTLYVVITDIRHLLDEIRTRFQIVRESPEDAEYL